MNPLLILTLLLSSQAFARSHSVRGHMTKRGTYVRAHRATDRNHTKLDNYSTRGNVNPYTGKAGTKDPYKK